MTDRLGVRPTEAWRRGQKPSLRGPASKEGVWSLRAEGRAPEGRAELIHGLLGCVPPSEDSVWVEIRLAFRVRFFIGLFGDRGNWGFGLPADVLARAARVADEIDFDVYCWPSEGDSASS